jgi:ABC-type uncharacterized transport system involved in gliding motility auxiliary subunit
MKNKWTAFFSIMLFFFYLLVIALWISIPEEVGVNLFVSSLAFIFTVTFILFNRLLFKVIYTSRYFAKLTSALLTIFLVFVILGFINYLGYKNPTLWDFSERGVHSLTDQSVKVAKSIKGDISVQVFSKRMHFGQIRSLLDLYRFQKKEIQIEYIDAELRPDLLKQHDIQKIPFLYIQYKKNKGIVSDLSELGVTNALIQVSRGKMPLLWSTTGHSEMNWNSRENEGARAIKDKVISSGYRFQQMDLRGLDRIPKEVDILLLWGMKSGLFDSELSLIKDYIKNGGNIFIAHDPNFKESEPHELRGLLAEVYGLELRNNLVIDRIKFADGSSGTIPVVERFNLEHPISKEMGQNVFFPLVSSVSTIADHSLSKDVVFLAQSSAFPAAWAENNLLEFLNQKVTFTKGEDLKGPVAYMAAMELSSNKGRMVVVGNSTFIINAYKKFPRNAILFLNSLTWLSNQDQIISFNLPVVKDRPIFMSKNQIGVIFYFSVVFAPLLLFALAFVIYQHRKRL